MWERLSLNLKLRISFGIVALLLICVGIVSTIYLNNTVKTFQHVSKISLPNVITIGELDSTANRIQLSLLQMGLSNNPQEIKLLDERIKALMTSFEETQKKYESIPFVKGEEVLYKEFKTTWDILKIKFLDLKALANDSSDEAIKKFSAGYIEESKDERDRFEKAVAAIINFQSNEGQMWAERANTMADSAKYITTTIIIIAVIAACILAFFISKNLTTTLRGLSLQIADGSHTLAETASEISSASESLSSSVHEQAAAIQEITKAMGQLDQATQMNSTAANQSSEASRNLSDQASSLSNVSQTLKLTIEGRS